MADFAFWTFGSTHRNAALRSRTTPLSKGDAMLYMKTSDNRFAFDFTYPTPGDELHNRLSLHVLESRGPGE